MFDAGFVYALTNRAMPGLVKVGFTMKLAEDRASDLSGTSLPYPFETAFRCRVMNPRQVERVTHQLLDPFRVSANREFFQIDIEQAIDAVGSANNQINGIHSWTTEAPSLVRRGEQVIIPTDRTHYFLHIGFADALGFATGKFAVLDIWQPHSPLDQVEFYGVRETELQPGVSELHQLIPTDPAPYLDRSDSVPNGTVIGIERIYPGERVAWIAARTADQAASLVVFESVDWCQIVCRTWRPMQMARGVPALWNLLADDIAADVADLARQALSLPTPRTATLDFMRSPETGPRSAPSRAIWLPQLVARKIR